MRIRRNATLLAVLLVVSGCASISYTLVAPGTVNVGDLQVSAAQSWNKAPAGTTASRKDTQVWTRDGLLLDRLIMIPAVPDGEPVFRTNDKEAALPPFRADMLPNEIEELTESSITKLFGEGEASVETSNLRPQRFGDDRGVLFNMHIKVTDSPDYKGLAGAFIADGKLYLMMYIAADPYYFDKNLAEVETLIAGARRAPAAG
ncbi:MAG: hypothetical protein OEW35_17185 [Gammaproteobacteria bacterium]|nr:hypothetical protein [Gammaproteobacteria bacterium]MDH4253937.1 hypothetical protein [Gammaproteobacteria bacterium]MDH5310584.1 hypothetical protein [Gammaproteobacteria bacterium]